VIAPQARTSVVDGVGTQPRAPKHGLRAAELRLLLASGDLAIGVAAVLVALLLWNITAGYPYGPAFVLLHLGWFAAAPAWMVALRTARQPRVAFFVGQTLTAIVHAAFALLVVYLAVYFYAPRQALPRLMVLHVLWQACLLTFAWRLTFIWLFTETSLRRRIVVVGTGRAGRALVKVLAESGGGHLQVAGFVDEQGGEGLTVEGLPVLGSVAALRDIVRREGAPEIIVALDGIASRDLVQALVGCQEDGTDVVQMATVYEQLLERVPVEYLESDWVITTFVDAIHARAIWQGAKRAIDLVGALAGLVALAVATPVVALATALDSGLPIFLRQVRVGRGGRHFELFKFRTMVRGAEAEGGARWAVENDPRVTRVGRWLRRLRIDELPQVINVLLGDMSLVGPRPERPEFVAELERRIPFYRTRLLVRPGLTGWAQVSFPYGGSVDGALVKLEYDLYYIKHRSPSFDARIALRTIGAIAGLKGQ